MNNIDIRKYIISNFKDSSIDDIKNSIEDSISSHEDDPLIGLGVLFELLWNNSNEEEKQNIVCHYDLCACHYFNGRLSCC